jgi:CRISPR-associated protein Cas2
MSHNQSRLWMIAYDISDHKIRRTLHEKLKDHGTPVQYSVFECHLKPSQLVLLRAEVQQLIEPDDSVRWYPICHWCETKVEWQGIGQPTDNEDFHLL